MAKMTDETLLSVLEHELQTSVTWAEEHLQDEQLKNLQYYLGMPMGNEVKGRSQIVSWDVFEVIESAMPGFLEPFFASDNIGVFQPRGPEDEAYAEQATDYVNYIVKQRNDGFQVFNTWIKDGLLSKVGVVRAEWEEEEPVRSEHRGLVTEQLQMLAAEPGVVITAHEALPMPGAPPGVMVHNVSFTRKPAGCVRVENVRPENFVLTSGIGSIRKARVIGEWVVYTRSELKELGFAQHATVDSYSRSAGVLDSLREDNFRGIGLADNSADETLEEIELFKGYVRADFNGDGIAEWRRVLVGGGEDQLLENEEAEGHNYAVLSPIMIPHRVIGMGYADPARQVQELKTALTRQYLDSLYLANRPRTYVNMDANVSMDDMLSDRIGGLIRGRGPADTAIKPLQTTAVSRDALEGLQLADGMRETRLGIQKFNPGLEADALHKTATGVRSINNLVDKRQKMTLRIMAETGIKDLFRLVLRLITQYQDVPAMVRLRGKFVPFDPRGWNPDMDCIVEVGVGTSDETETMMLLQQFGQYMAWAQTVGAVQPRNVYEYGKMLAKNARLKGADERLLTDPSQVPPQQPPPDPRLMVEQFKAQMQAQKFQAETQIADRRMQMETSLQMQSDQNRQEWEARQKQLELQQKAAVDAQRMRDEASAREAEMRFEVWQTQFEGSLKLQIAGMKDQVVAAMPQQPDMAPLAEQLDALTRYVMAPPKVLRDDAGVAVGVEKAGMTFPVQRDAKGRVVGLQPTKGQTQ